MNNLPPKADYVTAMRNPSACLKDKTLSGGSVLKSSYGVMMYAGGYSIVFPFILQNTKKKIAVRCWFADIGDARKRTETIANYLKTIDLPYFVRFEYKKDALLINGKLYPVVLMDWVEGDTLKDYINKNISNLNKLEQLAHEFSEMVKQLHKHNIAHGDLQHGNIIINNSGKLTLVDYDSMYVPDLRGMTDEIKGLPGYQHPARNINKFVTHKLDYFSELVIYLSILIFIESPDLWYKYKDTEELLFSKEDFINPSNSILINSFRKSKNKKIKLLTEMLVKQLYKTKLNELFPLEKLLIDQKDSIFEKMKKKPVLKNKEIEKPVSSDILKKFKKSTVKKKPIKPKKPDLNKIKDKF